MAKVVNGQLHVTAADLKKFKKDHGWDKPLAPGFSRFTDRNGITKEYNLADETKKMVNFFNQMGLLRQTQK